MGKTVLLKEWQRIARETGWVVIRHDLAPRIRDEEHFSIAISEYMQRAVEQLSAVESAKSRLKSALDAIGEVRVGPLAVARREAPSRSILDDRLARALGQIGAIARDQKRGVVFLLDEAHTLFDDPKKERYPLGSLLSAFVAAQDDDDEPNPVMLVLCGLPSLVGNIHAARSNAERFFRGPSLGNLPIDRTEDSQASPAALALLKPAEESGELAFDQDVAEQIARDVDGYPYFIQWFGEALWDAADLGGASAIDEKLYRTEGVSIQAGLDSEFFEPRYRDARNADQLTLRVAGSLGSETFTKSGLDSATQRSSGAIAQSLNRLIEDNLIYRDKQGTYAYTAPAFGEFLRRVHPRLPDDE